MGGPLEIRYLDNEADSAIISRKRAPLLSATAPAASIIITYKERLFAVDVRRPFEIMWTLPGFSDYWPPPDVEGARTYFQEIGSDGAPITAMWVQGNTLFIATADRIFPFILETDEIFTLQPALVEYTGVTGSRAVIVVEGIAYFAGKFGIYSFDGARATRISDKITPLYERVLIDTDKSKIITVHDVENERIYFMFSSELNVSAVGYEVVYFVYDYDKSDYRDRNSSLWTTGWFSGQNIHSASQVEDSSNRQVISVGFGDGKIRHLERLSSADDDDLGALKVILQTGFFPLGTALSRWTFHHLLISMASFTTDSILTTLNISFEQSFGNTPTPFIKTINTAGTTGGISQEKFNDKGFHNTDHMQVKMERNGTTSGFFHLFELAGIGTAPQIGKETDG